MMKQEKPEMSANTSEWKPTYIFPEFYLVSDCGSVKSLRTRKILRPTLDKHGYLYYVLCVEGNRKTVKAHRLVAKAFIDNPEHKPTVDHINGVKTLDILNGLMKVDEILRYEEFKIDEDEINAYKYYFIHYEGRINDKKPRKSKNTRNCA